MKLTEEERRELVELSGYKKFSNSKGGFYLNDLEEQLFFDDFQPSEPGNESQFLEILKNLTPEQKHSLIEELWDTQIPENLDNDVDVLLWYMNNRTTVLKAVIKVFTPDNKE